MNVALRPHQQEAADAAVGALTSGGSALVTMACGTGKTLVGVAVAEMLDCRLVLVAVPSLALADQAAAVWADALEDAALLGVCTDGALTGVRSTTDPAAVAAFCAGPGRRVVVATYQSSCVLAAAQSDLGVAPFDLAVADEAHHLAGPPPGPFGALVRGEVAADRRLLLTATPRTFVRRGGDVDTVGMDDEAVYGPRVYDLRLGAAIDAGLLADYQVVVAAVGRDEIAAATAAFGGRDRVDPATVAGAVATLRTMHELGLRRVVSFHSRVRRAHEFASVLAAAAPQVADHARPAGEGWVSWLYAGTPARTRAQVLERLNADGDAWAVVANARCLGEGVDVPGLDAVVIADPKTSDVDVAQAVGRVLRRLGDKVGAVVLPVVVDDPTAADPVVDERSLTLATSVLRALRAHDDRLGDRLDGARRARTGADRYRLGEAAYRAAWRSRLRAVLDVRVPPHAAAALAHAVTVRLVDGSTARWDAWFGLLETWTEAHGTAAVPQTATVTGPDGTDWKLGVWATIQRQHRRRGLLPLDREAALEALPGWEWSPLDARFAAQVAALASWAAVHGTADPPAGAVHDGVKVGQVVNVLRGSYRDGTLAPERVAALEALPGWCWQVRDRWWDGHFAQLAAWAAVHGHARPPRGTLVDGFDISRWVGKQRARIRNGTLPAEQTGRLRALPGWVDHSLDVVWWDRLADLSEWVARHGRLPGQTERAGDVQVGAWAAKQRQRFRDGRLAPERVAALEALPGWCWTPRASGHKGGREPSRPGTTRQRPRPDSPEDPMEELHR